MESTPSRSVSSAGLPAYFQNNAGSLREHPAGYIVFQYHPGKRRLADFQALLTHTGLLLRRNRWHRILADQRQMAPFTEEESTWVTSFWLDPVHQPPGGLFAAILLANDVFARLATGLMKQVVQSPVLTYHIFETDIQAAAWLQQA